MLNQFQLKLMNVQGIKILFIVSFFIVGCERNFEKLSYDEEQALEKISELYNVSASLELDYDAIRMKKNNGAYLLELNFQNGKEFCALDSIKRKKMFDEVKKMILTKLSHVQYHEKITISLGVYSNIENGIQKVICSERYSYLIVNDSLIDYYSEFSGNTRHYGNK